MEPSMSDSPGTTTLQIHRDKSGRVSVVETVAEISAPATEPRPAAPPCPRCGGKLTNPESLGWCPSCGYCQSLEQDAKKAALAAPTVERKASAFGIVEFVEVLGTLPHWLWVLLGGMGTMAMISLAANFLLPDDSLARALWSTIHIGAGLIGILAAQVWVFLLIAPSTDSISSKDLILSARLWTIACRRLPETRRQVWLGGWSVSAVLSGVFIVGGLSYWYQFYKPKKLADQSLIEAIAEAAKKQKKDAKSLEEALEDFANTQDLTKKKDEPKKDEKADRRPTLHCVIIGYTLEKDQKLGKDKINSLLVATVLGGRLRYSGVVKRGFDAQASDELLKRLAPLVEERPLFRNLNVKAIWVKPQVFCEVFQSGSDRDGILNDPRFKDLLTKD